MAPAQPQPLEVCETERDAFFYCGGGRGGLEVLRHRAGQDLRSVPKDSYGPLPMSTKLMAYLIAPFRRTHPHLLIRVMWGGNQRAGGPILRPVSVWFLSTEPLQPTQRCPLSADIPSPPFIRFCDPRPGCKFANGNFGMPAPRQGSRCGRPPGKRI